MIIMSYICYTRNSVEMLLMSETPEEFLGLSVLYDHKGGSLLNAQLLCKIRLLVGIDLGVFHAGLVKRRAGYFAVGAGGGHKRMLPSFIDSSAGASVIFSATVFVSSPPITPWWVRVERPMS